MQSFIDLFKRSSFYIIDNNEALSETLLRERARIVIPEKVNSFHSERKEDFIRGRLCAHMASLDRLKVDLTSIGTNEASRAPIWPQGIVGSITHSKRYASAAVADQKDLLGIGIDIEDTRRLKESLSGTIMTPRDLKMFPLLSDQELLALIFSAKESLYKALYPSVNQFFGFDKACVTSIDMDKKIFIIELLEDLSSDFSLKKRYLFEGKFAFFDSHILTVLEILHH
jgi:enterobactin synthetase component D